MINMIKFHHYIGLTINETVTLSMLWYHQWKYYSFDVMVLIILTWNGWIFPPSSGHVILVGCSHETFPRTSLALVLLVVFRQYYCSYHHVAGSWKLALLSPTRISLTFITITISISAWSLINSPSSLNLIIVNDVCVAIVARAHWLPTAYQGHPRWLQLPIPLMFQSTIPTNEQDK